MRNRVALHAGACAGGIALLLACGRHSPTTPTGWSAYPLAVTVGATPTHLTGTFQTGRLTATATWTDGTVTDVTSQVTWSSETTRLLKVSPNGDFTTIALGLVSVTALLSHPPTGQGRTSVSSNAVVVVVTPPGTFAVAGRVREPGSGDLGDVLITELPTGLTTTSASGGFTLGGLTTGRLSFTKTGYQGVEVDAEPDSVLDVPMQKVVEIAVGESVSGSLAAHDTQYEVGPSTICYTCRLIQLRSDRAGTLHLELTWGNASILKIWMNGVEYASPDTPGRLDVDLPIDAGAMVLYVGRSAPVNNGYSTDHLPFTLSTSLR